MFMRTYLRVVASFLLMSISHANTADFGVTLGLSNKVGIGTFLPRADAKNLLVSTLALTPFIISKKLYNDKKLKLSAEQNLDIKWLSATQTSASTAIDDLYLRASIKNALAWPDAHFAVTPTLETEIPFSQSSRDIGRLFAMGLNTALIFTFDNFNINLKPSFTGYFNNTPEKKNLCDSANSSEHCSLVNRQLQQRIKNTLSATYALRNHSFMLSFRSYHDFLRQLAPKEYLGPEGGNLKIATQGTLEYVYTMPISFPLTLTIGLSSNQPWRNNRGQINFPFFDFFTPANNYSKIYCGLEAVI
jgi:hypothetical protein